MIKQYIKSLANESHDLKAHAAKCKYILCQVSFVNIPKSKLDISSSGQSLR